MTSMRIMHEIADPTMRTMATPVHRQICRWKGSRGESTGIDERMDETRAGTHLVLRDLELGERLHVGRGEVSLNVVVRRRNLVVQDDHGALLRLEPRRQVGGQGVRALTI